MPAFRELWRKETQLNQQLTSAKEDLAKADQALRSLAGKVSLLIIEILRCLCKFNLKKKNFFLANFKRT